MKYKHALFLIGLFVIVAILNSGCASRAMVKELQGDVSRLNLEVKVLRANSDWQANRLNDSETILKKYDSRLNLLEGKLKYGTLKFGGK